jgi:hypothetical protein
MRRILLVTVLATARGCDGSASAPASPAVTPSAESFVGAWRSVTPPVEFIRLSVSSLSSERGALAARLTFSGVAWEGRVHIEGDSLVGSMTRAGTTQTRGTIVAYVGEGQALRVKVRPVSAAQIDVAFVRED